MKTIIESINHGENLIGGYTSELAFLDCVQEVEDATERKGVSLQDIRMHADENESVYLVAQGSTYRLRDGAIPSLCARLGISGSILSRFSPDELMALLNQCAEKHRDDEGALIVKIGDAVSAVLSDGYQVMEADAIFRQASEKIRSIGGFFVGGFVTMDMFSASYQIQNEKLVQMYRDKFDEGDMLRGAVPVVTVETSNTGLSSASIVPKFRVKGRDIIIGKSMRAAHKGENDLKRVEENLNQIFAIFKQAIDGLETLKKIKIENPSCCFKNIAKRVLLPKKYAMMASLDFDETLEDLEGVSAYDIYLALTETIFHAENDGRPAEFINSLRELIARALFVDYRKYDLPYSDWN